VDTVQGRIEVYVDGGIRTGSDVLKALALGAKCVFIGRPVVWGLAYKVRYFLSFTAPGKNWWSHHSWMMFNQFFLIL